MKVSFDFDGVLDRTDVFLYAKELRSRGIEIVIVTSRSPQEDNTDLYAVAKSIGMGHGSVTFTKGKLKAAYIPNDAIFHLDDQGPEIKAINSKHNFGTVGVGLSAPFADWKMTCEMLLSQHPIKSQQEPSTN